MISIIRADVPEYLCSGELFSSLAAEEEGLFEVPASAYRQNLLIENTDDLDHVLSSLRYWVVAVPPLEVIKYCLSLCTEVAECKVVLHNYARELPYCKFLAENMGRDQSTEIEMRAAIRSGYIQLVQYTVACAERAGGLLLSDRTFIAALEGDNVEILSFLVSKGQPTGRNAHRRWAYARSVACLKYLLTNCPDYDPVFDAYATHGDTVLIDFLLKRGYRWNDATLQRCIATSGLPMIQHLHKRGCTEWSGVTGAASSCGYLEILQYAHEHGAPWDPSTLYRAASTQHWDCFRFALEHGCPYDSRDANEISKHSMTMLRYLRERGYAMDTAQCMRGAILNANVEVLRYLRGEGVAWPDEALRYLAEGDSTAALKFAHEDGLSFASPEAYRHAMRKYGEAGLQRVCFLHDHGCPWDHTTVRAALDEEHYQCLGHLLQHGCPVVPENYCELPDGYSNHPVYVAALWGDSQALHILLHHGCRVALSAEQLETIQYVNCRKLLLEYAQH